MSLLVQTLTTHLAAGHSTAVFAAQDPFDGVVPNFAIFGADFNSWWKKLLAGVWGLSIVYCAFRLFPAALSLHRSRMVGNANSLGEASQELKFWGAGTLMVVAAGLVFGTLLAVAGN
jgi:hypothetical protein